MRAWIEILEEVTTEYGPRKWNLCFQKCIYHYENGEDEKGYRFIWRDENGNLRPQRGQARIPDKDTLKDLINEAKKAGWF